MRGQWKTLALATATAMALAACGGDQAADEPAEDTMPEMPAAEAPTGETGAQMGEQPQPMDLPEGVTQEQVTQGRQLFTGAGGCHACHGPDATGTQLAPDLTDGEWINVSGPNMDEVVQLINTGVPQPQQHPSPMPPMGGASLNEAQVQALAAYVVSLGQG